MLTEGKEGSVDLKKLYKELNSEYFGGACPSDIKLQWSARLKRFVGLAHCSFKGNALSKRPYDKWLKEIPVSNVEIDKNSYKIQMSKSFDLSTNDISAVMLHEMVHILLFTQQKVSGHHGTPEFDGWINKLKGQSGLDIPFLESAFKSSPKMKAKEGYIMIVWERNGNVGISMYSKNFLLKKWMVFAEALAKGVHRSSKVNKIEMYKATHPIVSTQGANRSIKLSWRISDEETVREIQRKGKIFLWGDKQSMTIHPIVFGETKYMIKKGEKITFDKTGQVTDVV